MTHLVFVLGVLHLTMALFGADPLNYLAASVWFGCMAVMVHIDRRIRQ